MTLKLDLRLLEVFVAVFDTRSVGQAARKLQMSQPGLSTALARLRGALKDPLFFRTSAGMQPTARARSLREPIRAILDSIESKLLAKSSFDPAISTREFRFALSDMGEAIYLPLAIQCIADAASSLSLRSVSMPPKELEEAMRSGAVDLAAGYFPDIKNSQFFHRRIGLHSFACIMRADHPFTAPRLTLKQFTELSHVVIEAQGRTEEVFEKFLRRKRIRRRVILHMPHFMSVPVIVANTDVIATVPQALADFISTQGNIKQVALPFVPPAFQVNIYWHRSAQHDAGNKWLRETLYSKCQVLKNRAYDRNARPRERGSPALGEPARKRGLAPDLS